MQTFLLNIIFSLIVFLGFCIFAGIIESREMIAVGIFWSMFFFVCFGTLEFYLFLFIFIILIIAGLAYGCYKLGVYLGNKF